MSITEKSGSFALDVISREQQNITRQAAIIRLAKESIAKSEARIKQWAQPGAHEFGQHNVCDCEDCRND